MVMPFNDSLAENIYRYYTKPVCKKINLALRRSDELFTNNPIIEDIIKEIKQDEIVIVDISGNNPNVFYELGISRAIKKKRTIIITHDKFDNIPFDLKHLRVIQYKSSNIEKQKYKIKLKNTLDNLIYKKMEDSQIIEEIANKTKIKEKDVEKMYNVLKELIKESLRKGEKVALIGFGTFATKERKYRSGVNPRTGKRISIPAKTVPYFKVGKELKEAVK